MDPQLLAVLVCPETRTPLRPAEAAIVTRLNQQVSEGTLKNRAGRSVSTTMEGGLVRQDGKFLYPVIDGIPVMLIDEAIPLEVGNSGPS